MADMRLLLEGLTVYHETLTRNLGVVDESFKELQQAWNALDEHFQGKAADEFRPMLTQSFWTFQTFEGAAVLVLKLLEQRIEHLKEADRNNVL
jgi:hypothetical protein